MNLLQYGIYHLRGLSSVFRWGFAYRVLCATVVRYNLFCFTPEFTSNTLLIFSSFFLNRNDVSLSVAVSCTISYVERNHQPLHTFQVRTTTLENLLELMMDDWQYE